MSRCHVPMYEAGPAGVWIQSTAAENGRLVLPITLYECSSIGRGVCMCIVCVCFNVCLQNVRNWMLLNNYIVMILYYTYVH